MTSRPSHASAPRPRVNLEQCTISDHAALVGSKTITVKENSVIHLRARLDSTHGNGTVGRNCIVSERARIGLQHKVDRSAIQEDEVELEDFVTVGPNAVVEARKVGFGSDVEAGARIGKGAVIGQVSVARKSCLIGSAGADDFLE